ncbi:E6 [Trichechus manatus latirostris papillomavirus 4]|uniref:Protein E6 n=1 Tax=Trichechus manatus latirostris papillomavirus 4 TaxID=2848317 RepID=A0A0F6TNA3_9PAPI|nr:E6 [Trichechus manatus latirostris papillomavirus 4]AKE50902.1 E6 [Trichechus manatus latirostris papillomavirus 4]
MIVVDNWCLHVKYRDRVRSPKTSYIRRSGRSPLVGMDQPTTLHDLQDYYGLNYWSIEIPCLICKQITTCRDRIHFERGRFKLKWKCGLPYAICLSCLRFYATYERLYQYRYSQPVNDVLQDTGLNLFDLSVRCGLCLALLTFEEKLFLSRTGSWLQLCKDKWRGRCSECRYH